MKPHPRYFVLAAALVAFTPPLIARSRVAPGHVGLAAPNADDGQALFKQRCADCHASKVGDASGGPNLAGVVGRGAAATGASYSAALKTSGIAWTRENLDVYLAAPQKLVPGTWMSVNVPDSALRALIIDYLASISPTPVPITPVPPITREPRRNSGH